ncbi:MAG: topoisomerase [Clostridia bacterium]|jgi:DNA topoisomerase-3|nr:topoisomerase [Clostridia bacterium]
MSYPDKYDEKLKFWNIYTLPFVPKEYKYEVIDSVSAQFNIVSKLLNREDIETIYVCTDSGREGEYIYRLVDSMANVKCKDKRRVWIDSQTEEAILNGIKDAKALSQYDALANSAYLRAKEDYLIGINFSRLLSVVYGKSLAKKMEEEKAVISIGRVMTCVLGMIVNREREIRDFTKLKFYKLEGSFSAESNFLADWKVSENSTYFNSPLLYNESGFLKENFAIEAKEYILKNKENAIISEINKKTIKENAPLLFNLAELQNECTRRFKISPDDTLKVAQTLYEKKMLTYPRTDARVLSTSAAKEISKNLNGIVKGNKQEYIKEILDKMIAEKYSTDLLKTKYVNDSKVTDHYALVPTGQGFENYNSLSDLEKNIFNMVIIRFLCIFYPPAQFSKINVVIDVSTENNKESFYTSGKVCIEEGYLEVVNKEKEENSKKIIKEDEEVSENKEEVEAEVENNIEILKSLKKGQKINLNSIEIKTGETSPSTRYNSGSIILAMENAGKLIEDDKLREQIKSAGIGTSATRAEIIKKLERIGYISSNKKTQILTPTKKGEAVYDIVKSSMNDLLNPELTASWEKGLNMVADGEIQPEEFMNKLEKYICTKVNKFKNIGY